MHAFMWVCNYIHAQTPNSMSIIFYCFLPYISWQGFSPKLEFMDLSRLASILHFPKAGRKGICYHAQLFMEVLGVQTKVIILILWLVTLLNLKLTFLTVLCKICFSLYKIISCANRDDPFLLGKPFISLPC